MGVLTFLHIIISIFEKCYRWTGNTINFLHQQFGMLTSDSNLNDFLVLHYLSVNYL